MRSAIFLGRFQPLHEGHKACIRKILESRDRVVILLRAGEVNEENPFTVSERMEMFNEWILEEDIIGKVTIVPIPDPDYDLTVFYGREVGYGIEELKMGEEIEAISATKIREQNSSREEDKTSSAG